MPIKSYTLKEMEDRFVGKKSTAARDVYEYELRMGLLGHMIKRARLQQKLTKDQLGKLAGLQKSQISKLENSANSASINTIGKVFKALDADVYFNVKFRNRTTRINARTAGK